MKILFFAARNVVRQLRRSLFTSSIIAIGTVAIMLSSGYMIASFFAVKEVVIAGGLGHLQIAHEGEFEGIADRPLQFGLTWVEHKQIEAAMEGIEEIDYLLPRLSFQGLISNGEHSLVFTGSGVDPYREKGLAGNFGTKIHGNGLTSGDETNPYRIVIGQELARLLSLNVGDDCTLLALTADGGLNAIDVTIVGLAETGWTDLDKLYLQAPLQLAKELLLTDKLSRLALKLIDTKDTQIVRDQLREKFGEGELSDDMDMRSWRELSDIYDKLQALYYRQFSAFAVILVLVILITVADSVIMNVLERTREVGTLLAIGISQFKLRAQFVLEGGILGFSGAAFGAFCALPLAAMINYGGFEMPPPPGQTSGYPLFIFYSWKVACASILTNFLLGMLAAWLASLRVAGMNIVKALRYG